MGIRMMHVCLCEPVCVCDCELCARWFSGVSSDSPESLSKSESVQHVDGKWIQVSTIDVHVTAVPACVQRRTNKDLTISLPRLTTRCSLTGNYAGLSPDDDDDDNY